MGPRTRRAVRGLKMKLREREGEGGVELGSASDVCLKEVGRGEGKRRWGDVKSCKVGVPVATVVSASPTSSEGSSSLPPKSGSARDKGKGKGRAEKTKEERSLADMMKDSSPAGDESITQMVAKVGRWWYTRCYESALLSTSSSSNRDDGSGGANGEGKERHESIFADKQLLGECEKWNASFKLVVAYAQKPVLGRRRTNSV